jgi:hypothetical protein
MTSYPTRQARVVPFMTFPGRECTSREPEKTSSVAGSRHVLGEADEITVTGQFVIIYQMDAIQTYTNYRSFRDGYSPVIWALNSIWQPGDRGRLAPRCATSMTFRLN